MNLTTVMLILKVALLMREMPMGEGWTTGTMLRDYSGVSHSTTYRYIIKLVGQGLLEPRSFKRGKLPCTEYRVTQKGQELLKSQQVIWVVS